MRVELLESDMHITGINNYNYGNQKFGRSCSTGSWSEYMEISLRAGEIPCEKMGATMRRKASQDIVNDGVALHIPTTKRS